VKRNVDGRHPRDRPAESAPVQAVVRPPAHQQPRDASVGGARQRRPPTGGPEDAAAEYEEDHAEAERGALEETDERDDGQQPRGRHPDGRWPDGQADRE